MLGNILSQGNWINWQINYLILLQNLRSATNGIFDNFFLFITSFGEITIPIFFMAGFYWCINKKTGFFLLSSQAFALIINQFLKMLACVYRPWILEEKIHPVEKSVKMSMGYSFPSGHSTTATAAWGALAATYWKNKLLRYSLIILIFLVLFSRNYLGVHTPQDVIVGGLIGVIAIILNEKFFDFLQKSNKKQLFIAMLIINIVSLWVLVFVYLKSYPMDYLNGELLTNPYKIKLSVFTNVGYSLGIINGGLIYLKFFDIKTLAQTVWGKVSVFLIGASIAFLYLIGTNMLPETIADTMLGKFFIAFIFGLYITLIFPLAINFFRKIIKKA